MNDLATLTTFFGWCTIINFAILILASISLMLMQNWISAVHSKMFHISNEHLANQYFQYLANYKILIFIFSFVPYLALKLMA